MAWRKNANGQWEAGYTKNGEWVGTGYTRNPVVDGKEMPYSSRNPATAIPKASTAAANPYEEHEESSGWAEAVPSEAGTGYSVPQVPNLYDSYVSQNPGALSSKPSYYDSYSGKLEALYRQISERAPFSYDAAKDPMYQSYKDEYIQGGKLAMRDTMGQAAALTGGYGSSYGQQVGQQAYDAYLQKLGEVIHTLYGMAYDQYKDAGDRLLQQYSMLEDLRDQEYGRYRDELSDWENERSWLSQLEAKDYDRRVAAEQQEYTRRMAEDERDYNRQQTAENTAYQRQQDAYANLYAAIKASGYSPTDEELAAAGMSKAAAAAISNEYMRQIGLDEREMDLRETTALGSVKSSSSGELWDYDPATDSWYVVGGSGSSGSSKSGSWGSSVGKSGSAGNSVGSSSSGYTGSTGSSVGKSGVYNLGELTDAAAAGASKSQIEKTLKARGVDTSRPEVQQDIKWALSK